MSEENIGTTIANVLIAATTRARPPRADLSFYFKVRQVRPIEFTAVTHTGSVYDIVLSAYSKPELRSIPGADGEYWVRCGNYSWQGHEPDRMGRLRPSHRMSHRTRPRYKRRPDLRPTVKYRPESHIQIRRLASCPSELFCPNRHEKPARGFSFAINYLLQEPVQGRQPHQSGDRGISPPGCHP